MGSSTPGSNATLRSWFIYQWGPHILKWDPSMRDWAGSMLPGTGSQSVNSLKYLEVVGPADKNGEYSMIGECVGGAVLRIVDHPKDFSDPPVSNATEVCAIDNETPYAILAYNEIYPLHCYPGRTWTTLDGHRGWRLPKYDSDSPAHVMSLKIFKTTKVHPNEVLAVVKICILNEDEIWVREEKDEIGQIVKGLRKCENRVQLVISGDNPKSFKVALKGNWFPRWEPTTCGLAGVMNNSSESAVVTTNHDGTVHKYTIEPYEYFDFANIALTKYDLGDAARLRKIEGKVVPELPVRRGGLVIPSRTDNEVRRTEAETNCIEIALGAQNWRIFKFGVNFLNWSYRTGEEHTHIASLIEGGSSQIDSPLKYIDIVGATDAEGKPTLPIRNSPSGARLRMVSRPHLLRPFVVNGHPSTSAYANCIASYSSTVIDEDHISDANGLPVKQHSYFTRVRLLNPSREGRPFANKKVQMRVEPAADATIQGKFYSASSFESWRVVDVLTDEKGEISIKSVMKNRLSAASYLLQSVKAEKLLSVEEAKDEIFYGKPDWGFFMHPMEKTIEHLLKLKTVQDFRDAEYGEGQKVFSASERISEDMVEGLQTMLLFATTPNKSNAMMMPAGLNSGCFVCKGNSEKAMKDAAVANASTYMQQDWGFSLDFVSGRWVNVVDMAEITRQEMVPPEKSIDSLWDFGSRLYNLFFGFVDGVLQIVVNGVRSALRWASETMDVFGAMLSRWAGAAWDGIVAFVGDLLDWDSIGNTYLFMERMFTNTIKNLPLMISAIAGEGKAAETSKKWLTQMFNSGKNSDALESTDKTTAKDSSKEDPSAGRKNDAQNSPAASWSTDSLVPAKSAQEPVDTDGAFQKAKNSVKLFLEALRAKIESASEQAKAVFKDKIDKIAEGWQDRSLVSILKDIFGLMGTLVEIGIDLGISVLSTIANLIVGIIDAIGGIVVYVPIISELFEKRIATLKGGNRKTTIFGVLLLSMTIPTVYLLKAMSWISGVDMSLPSVDELPNNDDLVSRAAEKMKSKIRLLEAHSSESSENNINRNNANYRPKPLRGARRVIGKRSLISAFATTSATSNERQLYKQYQELVNTHFNEAFWDSLNEASEEAKNCFEAALSAHGEVMQIASSCRHPDTEDDENSLARRFKVVKDLREHLIKIQEETQINPICASVTTTRAFLWGYDSKEKEDDTVEDEKTENSEENSENSSSEDPKPDYKTLYLRRINQSLITLKKNNNVEEGDKYKTVIEGLKNFLTSLYSFFESRLNNSYPEPFWSTDASLPTVWAYTGDGTALYDSRVQLSLAVISNVATLARVGIWTADDVLSQEALLADAALHRIPLIILASVDLVLCSLVTASSLYSAAKGVMALEPEPPGEEPSIETSLVYASLASAVLNAGWIFSSAIKLDGRVEIINFPISEATSKLYDSVLLIGDAVLNLFLFVLGIKRTIEIGNQEDFEGRVISGLSLGATGWNLLNDIVYFVATYAPFSIPVLTARVICVGGSALLNIASAGYAYSHEKHHLLLVTPSKVSV